MKSRDWHIQLNTTLPVIAAMKDALAASPVTLVFDHYGNAKEELGVEQPGFSDLVSLVKSGKAYVKISVTAGPRENYGYFTPLAQTLISANVDRILWGTNWPHPNSANGSTSKVTPLWQVDDGLVFNLCRPGHRIPRCARKSSSTIRHGSTNSSCVKSMIGNAARSTSKGTRALKQGHDALD